jgi:arginine exporter protein ArgO
MTLHTWQVYRWAGLFLAFQVAGCKTLPAPAVLILVFATLGAAPFLLYYAEVAMKNRYFAQDSKTKQTIKN